MGRCENHTRKNTLDDGIKSINPIDLFQDWFAAADKTHRDRGSKCYDFSNLRIRWFFQGDVIVLLKQFSEAGFVFYTNYNSNKGKAIDAFDKVGLTFFLA